MQDLEQLTREKLTITADAHFNAGRYRQAEKSYRKSLTGQARDCQALIMIGLCRHRRDDPDGALESFRQAVTADDNQPMAHYHLGRHYLDIRHIDQARESLAQAIALNPNHMQARTLYGFSFLHGGDHARAIAELKIARRAGPRYAPAAVMLASALLAAGQPDEAAEQAQAAVQLEPHNPGAQSVLGRALLAQGHVHFAAQCFRNALAGHPDNLELRAGLGTALCRAGEYAEATPLLEAALQGGLRSPEIGVEYARALAGLGRRDEALRILESLPEAARDTETRALLAELKLATGDADGARAIVDELPQTDPQKALLSARLHRHAGAPKEAVAVLLPLYEHDDAEIAQTARLAAADTWLEAEDASAAHKALEPLLSTDPPALRVLDFWARYLHNQQRWDELIALLEPVVARGDFGENVGQRITGLLVAALDAAGDTERAAELLPAAAWREPEFLRIDQSEPAQRAREALKKATAEQWQVLTAVSEVEAIHESPLQPIFILGWPGSGRTELTAVLAGHAGVRVLATDNAPERTRVAGGLARLDSDPFSVEQLDNARRRFLALDSESPDDRAVLDPMSYEVALLPGISRLFPGAAVIVVSAKEHDLQLQWLMSGYKRVPEILATYRAERDLFQAIAEHLPLEIIPVSRHRLLDDTAATLEDLHARLNLTWNPAVADDFTQRAGASHLRPDGHWKYYAAALGQGDS